jgi:hypothetical protein
MYDLDTTYSTLREKAFDWKDNRVPLGRPVGFILETGYPQAAFTLVAMSDGAISLYFSNGGGTVGAGAHQGPAEAAKALLRLAATYVEQLPDAREAPIPQLGEVRMYVLLNEGKRGVQAPEIDFGEGRSQFSPLFHAAHDLIAEISRIEPR